MSWSERWFALRCLFLLQAVALGVRALGYNRVSRWIEQHSQGVPQPNLSPDDQAEAAAWIGALVGIANRRIKFLQVTCLPESLTVWWLLRRRGLPAQIKMGVRRLDGKLDGHAWVMFQDRVVSGDPLLPQDYTPLGG
jgi:hypothetical protein